jgi:galactonate dehydratase
MKITGVKTYIAGNPWKNWLFAVVETDAGLTGAGEGTLNGFARTVETAIHELEPFYLGQDPYQIELITQRMTRDVYTDGGQIHKAAVAAVEIALWDIIGKDTGKPVYDLLGGRSHESLRAYANGWYRGPRTPEGFAERATAVVRRGYTALKFDPFGAAWRTMAPADEALSVDIIAAVREAVGPEVDLFVEGHCRFSVGTAIRLARMMEQYHPGWFEEPIHAHDLDGVARMADATSIPIATGESLTSKEQVAMLLKRGGVSVLQPEPLNLGGLLAARQVCAMADAHGVQVAPHSAQGPLCTAACVQLSASCPNFYVQELFDEFNVEWEGRIVSPRAQIRDGVLAIPAAAGLGGVALDLTEIALHPYAPTNYIPLFRAGWERRDPAVESETH